MARVATVKQKLTLGVGVVVLCMLVGTAFSVSLIHGLTSVVSRATRIYQLGKLAEDSSEMAGLSRTIILHSIFEDKIKVEEFKKQFEASAAVFQRNAEWRAQQFGIAERQIRYRQPSPEAG